MAGDEYSREELIEILQRVAARGSGGPFGWRAYEQLRREDEPAASIFRHPRYFGSWRAAVIAAGLEANPGGFTKDALIAILQRVAARGGGGPISWRAYEQLRRPDEPAANTFRQPQHFGTWSAAVIAAGLEANPPPLRRTS